MKIESLASSVNPSGSKLSISISAVCSMRGAWLSTPPEATSRSRRIGSTSDAAPERCAKASPTVRWRCTPFSPVAKALCCSNESRSASRATACSKTSASSVCGMVVGRIILFLTRLRSSRSSIGRCTQRRMRGMVASAQTLLME